MPNALMDITYETEIGAEQYALLGVMAKHDRRARICDLCEHCIKYGIDTVTRCKMVKNGSSRKGSFDPLKGVNCQSFKWLKNSGLLFQIENLLENHNYIIWVNPDV